MFHSEVTALHRRTGLCLFVRLLQGAAGSGYTANKQIIVERANFHLLLIKETQRSRQERRMTGTLISRELKVRI